MSLNCGIVGLPNVGKSTIFSAITAAPAEVANYPFCTIEPNVGVVTLKDPRLDKIAALVKTKRKVSAIVEFVDIAGLVKGASKGEGLGNQFLGHIRQVNAIIHVVRCFSNENILHVNNVIDPVSDIETINLELCLADLETVTKRIVGLDKFLKSQDKEVSKKARISAPILEALKQNLSEGKRARSLNLSTEDEEIIRDLHLITMRPILYACNVDEGTLKTGTNDYVEAVKKYVQEENGEVVVICGKLEHEINLLDSDEEKKVFMQEVGIVESGLDQLVRSAYRILGLRTYFTAGVEETRAWTFEAGMKAPQAAGVIHSDFERGFIRAEVYRYSDLFELGSELKVKEAGRLRLEGKDYLVQDGDVMFFRFNV